MKKFDLAVASLIALSACSVYDNYDIDLMQDASASVESSSSVVIHNEEKSSSSEKGNVTSSSSDKQEAVSSSSEKAESKSSSSEKADPESSSSEEKQSSSSVIASSSSAEEPAESSSSQDKTPDSSSSQDKIPDSSSSVEELSSSSEIESSSSAEIPVVSSSSVAGFICGDSVMVRGGYEYKTIKIKGTCWTAENMKYVPLDVEGHACYENDDANCDVYGRLYNYEAAENICNKNGWRLPTKDDLDSLLMYTGEDPIDAGMTLKSPLLWNPDGDGMQGTDELGFSALPGGVYTGSKFANLNNVGNWWTSQEKDRYSHHILKLSADDDAFYTSFHLDNSYYASVRCVRDLE